jgi:tetratricopeptide (TPR) repeat protein
MIYKLAACALVLIASAWGATALAQGGTNDFQNCDGYRPPSGNNDGMSSSGGFWLGPGDRVRRTPNLRTGLEACTRALSTLDGFPNAWLRRVSILQSRAIHRLNQGDLPGALEDLDLADAAAAEPQDPFYLRSLAINTNLIRAYALVEGGDQAAAEALVMTTWAQRPYSIEVVGAALTIVGEEASQENLDRLMRAAGQIDPSLSGLIFKHEFETGRFEAALADYTEIVAPMRNGDRGVGVSRTEMIVHAEQQRIRMELFLISVMGQKAYALAALGRNEEARAALEVARARIAQATSPGMSASPGTVEYVRLMARQRSNQEIQSHAPTIRDAWAKLVEARIAASEGRFEDARAAFEGVDVLPSYAVVDLMVAAHADEASIAEARQTLPPARLGLADRNPETMFSWLLDAETFDRTTNRLSFMDALLGDGTAGDRDCEQGVQGAGQTKVCYSAFDATLAVTQERALLRAAARAARRGGRFRIEQREDIQHAIVGGYGGQTQDGFETSLTIRFFDADDTCARCISAADVQATLASIYNSSPARQ